MASFLKADSAPVYQDKVMDHSDWHHWGQFVQRHKPDPTVLLRTMSSMWIMLLLVCVESLGVGVYYEFLVPLGIPQLHPDRMSPVLPTLTFSLSLLLVFKTNHCYARWWEARTAVGQMVGHSTRFAAVVLALMTGEDAPLKESFLKWIAAFNWAAREKVTPGANLKAELDGWLDPQELGWLLAQPNKPQACMWMLAVLINEARGIDGVMKAQLIKLLEDMCNPSGAMIKIFNTAIPIFFTQHTSRFLVIYLAVLPILVWPFARWGTPVLTMLIAFLLMGIENVGSKIMQPFQVLAFEQFCKNVQGLMKNNMSASPPPRVRKLGSMQTRGSSPLRDHSSMSLPLGDSIAVGMEGPQENHQGSDQGAGLSPFAVGDAGSRLVVPLVPSKTSFGDATLEIISEGSQELA